MRAATDGGRNNVVIVLEHEIVQVSGSNRPQRPQFGSGVRVAEDIEGPGVHGPAAQVGLTDSRLAVKRCGINFPSNRPPLALPY